jgi:hypothetical protein
MSTSPHSFHLVTALGNAELIFEWLDFFNHRQLDDYPESTLATRRSLSTIRISHLDLFVTQDPGGDKESGSRFAPEKCKLSLRSHQNEANSLAILVFSRYFFLEPLLRHEQ